MKHPVEALQKGDLIAIVAPAKAIEKEFVDFAEQKLIDLGFKVIVGKNCLGRHNYFSGTEAERLADFQWALDHEGVKAIVCARGGYGCVQLVDRINWAGQLSHPKWIIGFSDITVFHQRMQKMGIPSIHGTMPLNFKENSLESFETLIQATANQPYSIEWSSSEYDKSGSAQGELVGGNLSILYSLIGTNDQVDFSGKILFIEDLAEQIYAIDRMFYALSKAEILDKISGLVIGGMTKLNDTDIPFGKNYLEVILSHLNYRKIPVAFNIPAGHIDDNRALKLGSEVNLIASDSGNQLVFTK